MKESKGPKKTDSSIFWEAVYNTESTKTRGRRDENTESFWHSTQRWTERDCKKRSTFLPNIRKFSRNTLHGRRIVDNLGRGMAFLCCGQERRSRCTDNAQRRDCFSTEFQTCTRGQWHAFPVQIVKRPGAKIDAPDQDPYPNNDMHIQLETSRMISSSSILFSEAIIVIQKSEKCEVGYSTDRKLNVRLQNWEKIT